MGNIISIEFRGLVRPLAWDPYADANAYFDVVLNGDVDGCVVLRGRRDVKRC